MDDFPARPVPDPDHREAAPYAGDRAADGVLFSAPPSVSTAASPEASVRLATEVKHGAESGMARFCEQAFTTPDAARVGSQALVEAFDDSGLWLAGLVQPAHLVAELRQQCCLLTRVVITQWTRQGETLKLVRLAEALAEAAPPVLTHEAGQIMALLASLLGILRPAASAAPRWLELGRPLLKDSVDPHLLKEACQWVAVGQMLASLPPEDRVFWNRRLREPDNDWEWESAESLEALRRLAPLLAGETELLLLFQAVIPRCWWEMWRNQEPSAPKTAAVPPKAAAPSGIPAFMLGLGVGAGLMMLAFWWATARPQAERTLADGDDATRTGEPVFSFHPVAEPATRAAAKKEAKKQTARPVKASLAADVPVTPSMQARLAKAGEISKDKTDLQRLHNLVKNASAREALPHVQGRTMMAPAGSPDHSVLLRWLLLDPPEDPEVRAQVSKVAARVLDPVLLYETLDLCLVPDSPNLEEARECAELLLALEGDGLSEGQRQHLTAATASR